MKRCAYMLLLVLWIPSTGWGQSTTANDYFEGCEIAAGLGLTGDNSTLTLRQKLAVAACLGFVDGANGSTSAIHANIDDGSGSQRSFCPPEELSNYGALTIWVNYLQQYPIQLSEQAATSYLRAMTDTYPCP